MFYFIKIKKKMISMESDPEYNSPLTLESNKRRVIPNVKLPKHPRAKVIAGLDIDVSATKSLDFINFSKFYYKNKLKDLKILIIGPRNESEIFAFASAGYVIKNITAIDLFSYSPLIRLMDMHNLDFEENTFDLVYAGWVIAYSDNRLKAISEMQRVAKKGGVISLTAGFSNKTNEEIVTERGYMIGSKNRLNNLVDLVNLFDESSGSIIYKDYLWRENNAAITCYKKQSNHLNVFENYY